MNTRIPLVTIVIPTYNQASFLPQTIASALAQDYPNLEVLVSDDCSPDGTRDIVGSIVDPRLRYIRNERNLGRVGNYRKALYEAARGAWALNLDGDDVLLDTGFISAAVAATQAERKIAFVFADRYERDDPFDMPPYIDEARGVAPEYWDGTEYVLSLPKPKARIHHLAALYDREAAMGIDFYRADITSSDYESLWRLAVGRTIAHLPAKAAIWRRHSKNVSRTGGTDAVIENFSLFRSVHDHAVRTLGPSARAAFDDWLTRNVANRYYGSLCNQLRSRAFSDLSKISAFVKEEYPHAYRSVLRSPLTYVKGSLALLQSLRDFHGRPQR